jgi:REP element-mobilizing transposase RayT
MRAVHGAAFFRRDAVFPRVRETIRRANRAAFRVVHFSVQANHVHLLVEAEDGRELRAGMQGLATRLARTLDETVGRRGRVWAERYHRHDLRRPSEVRHALVYVLQNGRKHGVVSRNALDPRSSARWLVGWNARGARLARGLAVGDEDASRPAAEPLTWLLREGWLIRGGGALDPAEEPRHTLL